MRLLLFAAIALSGLNAQAYFIWARRDDISCVGLYKPATIAHLQVFVKDKIVVDLPISGNQTDANAAEAYCEGVLRQARDLGCDGIFINTETSLITGRLLTIDETNGCGLN